MMIIIKKKSNDAQYMVTISSYRVLWSESNMNGIGSYIVNNL